MRQVTAAELGPAGYDKIAIVGSAPSSVRLAPYTDPTWAIWGCSPGAYGEIPPGRSDVFFELHRWEPAAPGDPRNAANKPWFSPEYVRFLEQHKGPVYMAEQVPTVQNSVVYPFDEMNAEFGPYFWTSSMAYMLALAIKLRPRAIGLWGVDMAAHSEYAFQRPGCQNFMGIAAALGIKIVVPLESDLLQPPTPYGKIENHPRHVKLLVRRQELAGRMAMHQQQVAFNQGQAEFCKGAVDNLDYILSTWADDTDPGIELSEAIMHSAMVAGRPVAIEAALHRFAETSIPAALELVPPVEPPKPAEDPGDRIKQEIITAESVARAKDKLLDPTPGDGKLIEEITVQLDKHGKITIAKAAPTLGPMSRELRDLLRDANARKRRKAFAAAAKKRKL